MFCHNFSEDPIAWDSRMQTTESAFHGESRDKLKITFPPELGLTTTSSCSVGDSWLISRRLDFSVFLLSFPIYSS